MKQLSRRSYPSLVKKAKQLSTRPAEMPPEQFRHFHDGFFNWSGCLGLLYIPVHWAANPADAR